MTTYQAEYADGFLKNDLTFDEAEALFDEDDRVIAIRPWPVQEYNAP